MHQPLGLRKQRWVHPFSRVATVLALVVALVACGQAEVASPVERSCDPPVGTVRFGSVQDPEVEKRLQALYAADQAARTAASIDLDSLRLEDSKRRAEVMAYISDGKVVSGWSQFHAAMVFQHGTCPDHYRLANRLAELAMEQGITPARWLSAASMDRFLRSQGKTQKYGTQYRLIDGKWELEPVDPATSDEERAKYNVPPLSQAKSIDLPAPKTNR